MTWFHAARARLRLLAPRAAESRIDDEIRFHIEMETQRLVREQKLDHDEARRRALVTFGGVQQHRETLREGRGTAWFSGLSLDLKLGFRMLVKYPGLTVIGGLAMAFGIWFGAVTFQMFGILTSTEAAAPGRRSHREDPELGSEDEPGRGSRAVRLPALALRAVDHRPRRLSRRERQPGGRGRQRAARGGGGDHRVRVPHRPRASPARPRARTSRTNVRARRPWCCSATTCGPGASIATRRSSDATCSSGAASRRSSV